MNKNEVNMLPNQETAQAVAGLAGYFTQQGDIRLYKERLTRIQLPKTFTAEHIEMMLKDIAIISRIAENNKDAFLANKLLIPPCV